MLPATRRPTYRRGIYPPPNRSGVINTVAPSPFRSAEVPALDDSYTYHDTRVVPSVRPSTEARAKMPDTSTEKKKKDDADDHLVPQAIPTGLSPVIVHNYIDVNDCRPAPPRRKPNPPPMITL